MSALLQIYGYSRFFFSLFEVHLCVIAVQREKKKNARSYRRFFSSFFFFYLFLAISAEND